MRNQKKVTQKWGIITTGDLKELREEAKALSRTERRKAGWRMIPISPVSKLMVYADPTDTERLERIKSHFRRQGYPILEP